MSNNQALQHRYSTFNFRYSLFSKLAELENFRNIFTSEKKILLDATQALARLAGVRIEQLPVWASYGRIYQDNQAVSKITDAHISISSVGTTRAFDVEIKGELRKDQVLPIIERFGRDKENYLLVARYIPQPIKEYFVKVGVNYLESAGNCSIKAPGLLLYISDQKVTPVREAIPGKLWKRTGLKFLLAIIGASCRLVLHSMIFRHQPMLLLLWSYTRTWLIVLIVEIMR